MLGFLDLVMREERAGVAWKDMLRYNTDGELSESQRIRETTEWEVASEQC